MINEETGIFEYDGNIYEDPEILETNPELASEECKPKYSDPTDKWIIAAKTAKTSDVDLSGLG